MWMSWRHITDKNLEKYCLGMIKDEAERAAIESHLLACPGCVERAEGKQHRLAVMFAAMEGGTFGLQPTNS